MPGKETSGARTISRRNLLLHTALGGLMVAGAGVLPGCVAGQGAGGNARAWARWRFLCRLNACIITLAFRCPMLPPQARSTAGCLAVTM